MKNKETLFKCLIFLFVIVGLAITLYVFKQPKNSCEYQFTVIDDSMFIMSGNTFVKTIKLPSELDTVILQHID